MCTSITLEYLNHALEAFRRGNVEKAYSYLLVAQGAERARVEWECRKDKKSSINERYEHQSKKPADAGSY